MPVWPDLASGFCPGDSSWVHLDPALWLGVWLGLPISRPVSRPSRRLRENSPSVFSVYSVVKLPRFCLAPRAACLLYLWQISGLKTSLSAPQRLRDAAPLTPSVLIMFREKPGIEVEMPSINFAPGKDRRRIENELQNHAAG